MYILSKYPIVIISNPFFFIIAFGIITKQNEFGTGEIIIIANFLCKKKKYICAIGLVYLLGKSEYNLPQTFGMWILCPCQRIFCCWNQFFNRREASNTFIIIERYVYYFWFILAIVSVTLFVAVTWGHLLIIITTMSITTASY